MQKTIASLTVTVEHIKARLGPRAGLDAEGLVLLHEAKNILAFLGPAATHPPSRAELLEITDRVARLDAQAKTHRRMRRLGKVVERLPPADRPTPEAEAAIREALEGPAKPTLVTCPACSGCPLCADVRLVRPAIAVAWEREHPKKPGGHDGPA